MYRILCASLLGLALYFGGDRCPELLAGKLTDHASFGIDQQRHDRSALQDIGERVHGRNIGFHIVNATPSIPDHGRSI